MDIINRPEKRHIKGLLDLLSITTTIIPIGLFLFKVLGKWNLANKLGCVFQTIQMLILITSFWLVISYHDNNKDVELETNEDKFSRSIRLLSNFDVVKIYEKTLASSMAVVLIFVNQENSSQVSTYGKLFIWWGIVSITAYAIIFSMTKCQIWDKVNNSGIKYFLFTISNGVNVLNWVLPLFVLGIVNFIAAMYGSIIICGIILVPKIYRLIKRKCKFT